jgi:hypothetical protein
VVEYLYNVAIGAYAHQTMGVYMPFDPLSWAIGFALNKTLGGIWGQLCSNQLPERLHSVVRKWAASLPDNAKVCPDAIFLNVEESECASQPSSLIKLRATLNEKRIPPVQEWHAALVEQWTLISQQLEKEEAQAFFQLARATASEHLKNLSKAIVGEMEKDREFFQSEALAYLRSIHEYLRKKNVAELCFMELPDEPSSRFALKLNQGHRIILDRPAFWCDFHKGENVPFPREVEVDPRHSRRIRAEGTFRHSSEGHNRAIHTIRFAFSNSGDTTLVVKQVRLLVHHCERNSDHHVLGISVEAGPLRTVVIKGIDLDPKSSETILTNKQFFIEPYQALALEFELKSPDNYNYRVTFAFDWVDFVEKRKRTTFSETYLLKYPSYSHHHMLPMDETQGPMPVLPLLDSGKINPVVARILLNPTHSYFDDVVFVIKYHENGNTKKVYEDFLRLSSEDPKADQELRHQAKLALMIVAGNAKGSSLTDPEFELSIGRRLLRQGHDI